MAATQLIAARVSPETKAKFRALAERQQVTESVLLKQLVDSITRGVGDSDVDVLRSPHRRSRESRLCVRLRPDDQLLLGERSAARQMPAATYVSVLVRAHLRHLTPLPKDELSALKATINELAAVGRNLNQIARATNSGGRSEAPSREELRMIVKVCEALRDRTKSLIMANVTSWNRGHAEHQD